MQDSLLQRVKGFVQSVLDVSPDLLLVFLGLGCFLTTCLIARRPLTWVGALVPGLCLSVILEAMEIWGHYGTEGLAKTGASDLARILLRHAKDILIMNLAPSLILGTAILLDRFSSE